MHKMLDGERPCRCVAIPKFAVCCWGWCKSEGNVPAGPLQRRARFHLTLPDPAGEWLPRALAAVADGGWRRRLPSLTWWLWA